MNSRRKEIEKFIEMCFRRGWITSEDLVCDETHIKNLAREFKEIIKSGIFKNRKFKTFERLKYRCKQSMKIVEDFNFKQEETNVK